MSKHGLGRGLESFFGAESVQEDETRVQSIPLADIDPNEDQPRRRFDAGELEALALSIRSVGVIQPITVYQSGTRYKLIAGERRWRAARLAGLAVIPALVRDIERLQRMKVSLIENVQRSNLNAVEEATAIHALIEDCGLTQDAVAQSLGRSRPAVTNLLRLLSLPTYILDMVEEGELSEGHARALIPVEDELKRRALADQVCAQGLSVRQLEALVKKSQQEAKPAKTIEMDSNLSLIENAARSAFGSRVTISGTQNKGRLVISYGNRNELERIYQTLAGLTSNISD